jgi:hypothetical protein
MLPHDFPPWEAVSQQSRRWLAASVFNHLMGDLRELLREAHDKNRLRRPVFSTAEHCNPRQSPMGVPVSMLAKSAGVASCI